MTTNNSMRANNFNFFYLHSYGYAKKIACPELSRRELYPDYQAVILVNQPNSLITSVRLPQILNK